MLLAFCATMLTGTNLQTARYVARMQAWEAHFESAQIPYRYSEAKQGALTLCVRPSQEVLLLNGKPVQSYEGGVFRRLLSETEGSKRIAIAYGTPAKQFIPPMLSSMREVLYSSGVLLSEAKTSELLAKGKLADQWTKGDTTRVTVALPNRNEETLTVTWKGNTEMPSQLEYRERGLRLVRSLTRIGKDRWPVRMTLAVQRGNGKLEEKASCVVNEPTPLLTLRTTLKERPGDEVYDEDYGFRYIAGESQELDLALAGATLRNAKQHQQTTVVRSRQLLCGVDCLFYFAQLKDMHPSYKEGLELLPEAIYRGSSFLDLQRLGKQWGLDLVGRRLKVDDLRKLDSPAVLSLRGAHFVLYVPGGKGFTLLNPPYSVGIFNEKDLSTLWTGDALLERQ